MLSDEQAVGAGKKHRIWKAVFIVMFVAIVVAAAFLVYRSTSDNHRGLALQELSQLPAGKSVLGKLILANYHEYRTNSILWSFAYFGCLFGSAFASALAGVVLKLDVLKDNSLKNDSAASLAAIAALLVTLSTSGDFQRKWQANRTAADAMENLSYDLLRAEKPSPDLMLDRIKAINEARSEGVVGKGGKAEVCKPRDDSQVKGSPGKSTTTPERKVEDSQSGAT